MRKKEEWILKHFGIQELSELLGRKMRVEFRYNPDGESYDYTVFFLITSFTFVDGELSFDEVPCVQGTRVVQISFFKYKNGEPVDFHINLMHTSRQEENREDAYFYNRKDYGGCSRKNITKGSVTLI